MGSHDSEECEKPEIGFMPFLPSDLGKELNHKNSLDDSRKGLRSASRSASVAGWHGGRAAYCDLSDHRCRGPCNGYSHSLTQRTLRIIHSRDHKPQAIDQDAPPIEQTAGADTDCRSRAPEVGSGGAAAAIVTAPEPSGWRISSLKLRGYDSDARNLKVRTPPRGRLWSSPDNDQNR